MEKMNALTLIITLVVGVILTGALLGPVISDATKTTETFTNVGYYDMRFVETDESVTMVWDPETPNQITVNSETVNFPTASASERKTIILGGDNIIFRYYGDPTIIQITTTGGSAFVGEDVLTVDCANGTITATWGTNSRTGTYSQLFVPSNNGGYTMKQSNQVAYMNGDSEIIAMGITNIGGTNEVINVTGSIESDVTFSSWNTDLTFSDITINATKNSDYVDIYELSNITAMCGETAITYSYFLVPAQVTSELTNHLTPGQISLMGAIPVMVIVALLMAAVGAIALRRAD